MEEVEYYIRPLSASDLTAYKCIRLEALQTEPGMFGNSYATEAAMIEQQWLDRLTNPARCCFGLYHNKVLIGITAIVVQDGIGYMTQSYIRKEHRGKRLSRLFYEIRIDWARNHGLSRLEIGHRKSNIISKAANQRYGFRYSKTESRTWPDGVTEDMVYYKLEL